MPRPVISSQLRELWVTTRPLALAYVEEADMHWPLLVDESCALYAAYGMHRGQWRDILG
ncbi:MAG: hypothetical protein WD049_08460 [Candidatus Paceibacterota bacterium]